MSVVAMTVPRLRIWTLPYYGRRKTLRKRLLENAASLSTATHFAAFEQKICQKAADINEMKLHAQITDLVKEKELKVEDYEARVNICEEIRQVLIAAGYTNCLVYPYGSTINNVGFKNSDLGAYSEGYSLFIRLKVRSLIRAQG